MHACEPVTPDYVEGMMWLEIVWAQPYGFDYDKGCLTFVSQKASAAEKEEAKRLAEKWMYAHSEAEE